MIDVQHPAAYSFGAFVPCQCESLKKVGLYLYIFFSKMEL